MSLKNRLISLSKKALALLPAGTVKYIYLKVLSPKPLRWAANQIIKVIMPASVSLEEGRVILDKGDVEVSGALALGAHDPFEIELFRKALRSGMNVIDIGANIGYYTVIAAGRVGSRGKVFAYEPEEKNFALVEQNIAANGFSWAKAVKSALSDKPGTRTLFLARSHTGIHSFANNRGFDQGVEVAMDTLDRSLEAYESPKIDLIKMDIEGAEPLALEGMRETIARSDSLILFTEIYPQAIERLGRKPIDFLKALDLLDFSLYAVDEDRKTVTPLRPMEFGAFLASIPETGEVVRNIIGTKGDNKPA